MKRYLLYITLTLLSACSTLKSDLTVQPGKQFRLGGNQNGAFTVQLKNTGQVPVTVSEQPATGQSVVLGTFRPGEGKTVRFAAGSAALVDNATDKSARLYLVVTGDKNLSMKEISRQ
ncbi:hypothetical protein [Persicitalea sp.]|uniref:hypothetical protein n=1 Tax=Persicitalea sp. TaxID=3100273 RepID=UPI003593F68C